MLNEFLKVAYEHETRRQEEYELVGLLKSIPTLELRKLADGTPVAELYKHLEKTAHDDPGCFLDRFKGTPLFDQALALEQEELQAEMLDQQKREEQRTDMSAWDLKDKIRLKKRMLELELAKQEAGASPIPGEPVQGAGAPGPVPAEGVQDASQGLQGGVAKVGSAYAEKVAFADQMGRALARADFEKAAHAKMLNEYGTKAGAVMAKEALNMGAVTGALGKLGPMAGKALGFAAKNPGLVGAGIGAAGGALASGGLSKDQQGNRHLGRALAGAAGGAALGGAAGQFGGGVVKSMKGGAPLSAAIKGEAGDWAQKARGVLGVSAKPPATAGVVDPSTLGHGAVRSVNPVSVQQFATQPG